MDTTLTHSKVVRAAVDEVYRLIADVSLWPVIFEPTVHVEHLDRSLYSERFQLWALVASQLQTWVSKREFDPVEHRITFRQERSHPPVASMGGTWSFHPLGAGQTKVELHHEFSVTDPGALDGMRSAVDQNSSKELDALARVAELGSRVGQLTDDFSDTVFLRDGSLADAYDFVYRCDLWPDRLPHVARVNLTEDEPGTQYLEMDTVTADGSAHTTRSVRVCVPNSSIAYKQLQLPGILLGHSGRWAFTQVDQGVQVTAAHAVLIDPQAARAALGNDSTLAQARTYVRSALGGNGRATLTRMGEYVQQRTVT